MKQATTSDVSREILLGLGYLAQDERYMQRALKSVNRLVAEKRKEEKNEEPCCFSTEELNRIVEESLDSIANGYEGIPSNVVFAELKKEFPYLCE